MHIYGKLRYIRFTCKQDLGPKSPGKNTVSSWSLSKNGFSNTRSLIWVTLSESFRTSITGFSGSNQEDIFWNFPNWSTSNLRNWVSIYRQLQADCLYHINCLYNFPAYTWRQKRNAFPAHYVRLPDKTFIYGAGCNVDKLGSSANVIFQSQGQSQFQSLSQRLTWTWSL